jgi:hypothetical protein
VVEASEEEEEEVVEASEEEEEEVVEASEEEEEEEEEEGDEVYEVTINDTLYYTNNEKDGDIFECLSDDDVGDVVGSYKDGTPVFTKE